MLTVSTDELEVSFIVIGLILFSLIVLGIGLVEERRELILEDVENRRSRKNSSDNLRNCNSSDNLRNCICGCGVEYRCPVYHEDLKALKKALDNSKCKHIRASLMGEPIDDS